MAIPTYTPQQSQAWAYVPRPEYINEPDLTDIFMWVNHGTNRQLVINLALYLDEPNAVIDEAATEAAGGGGVVDAKYLVGEAHVELTDEIVVGLTPGGELGGSWANPTVDAIHSGSAHHAAESGESATHVHDTLYEALGDLAIHAALPDEHHVAFVQADADLLYEALGDIAIHALVGDAHHEVYTAAIHTAVGDSAPHHVRQHGLGAGTDHANLADYSVTLGLAKLAVDDANFYLDIVSSKPQIVLDTGDFWEWDRENNALVFKIASTEIFKLTTSAVTMRGEYFYLGVNNTKRGQLVLYGPGAGSKLGGLAYFHLGADHDGIFDYYIWKAYEDDLILEHNSANDLIVRADRSIEVVTGPLKVDTINEYTPDAGVTIEGNLFKDSYISPASDANFTLSIVSGNPRLTLDSGDYLEYVRASNRLDLNQNLTVAGYARIGANSDPTNTAAGNVTIERMMVGANANDFSFGSTSAYYLFCAGDLTDTAAVQSRAFMVYPTIDPPSNSSASFRSLHLSALLNHGASTLTEVILGHLAGTVLGAANVATYRGLNTVLQATANSAATLSLGTVTSFSAQLLVRTGTPAITATTVVAYEIYGAPGNGIAGDSWGTIIGLRIPNLGGTRTTNAYGIQITGQASATGSNIGIWFNTDTTNQGGGLVWGASKDTNLYRSAADVLKTDDGFVVGAGLNVTLKSLLGLHTLTGNNQADVILFSNAAGTGAQSGAYYNKLRIFGGGSQTRDLELYQAVSGDAYIDAYVGSLHLRTTYGTTNILLEPTGGIVQITSELHLDGDFNHDGSNVGFYGTAPVAQQTGVAVSAAAIHAALVNLGLITA